MKQRAYRSLPYPLLSQYTDDYVNSSFTQAIKTRIFGSNLIIDLNCALKDTALEKLIEEGKASVVYHIECSQTGYRCVVRPNAGRYQKSYQIPFHYLHGDVDINTFVIATQKLDYRNANFNPDYQGMTFAIDVGCRLAEAEIYSVNIPLQLTDFVENSNPYVVVIPREDDSSALYPEINLNAEKIQIIVPKTASRNFAALQGTSGAREVLYCMFLVPAVYQGLLEIKSTKGNDIDLESMKNLLWVQSMEDELKKRFQKSFADVQEMENNELYIIADSMLGNPLVSGTNYLMKLGSSGSCDAD